MRICTYDLLHTKNHLSGQVEHKLVRVTALHCFDSNFQDDMPSAGSMIGVGTRAGSLAVCYKKIFALGV